MSNKIVNHVIFALDRSGSMQRRISQVERVYAESINKIRATADSMGQETRVSLYYFDQVVDKIKINSDIKTDSGILHLFFARGMTAMRDAAARAIVDHQVFVDVQGEDHTFLVYVVTDGEDNASKVAPHELAKRIADNIKDFTMVALVPDSTAAHYAKLSGFPAGNIQIWDVNAEKGFEEVGEAFSTSYQTYTTLRSQGVRSSSTIFQTQASSLTKADLKKAGLQEVKGTLHHAQKDQVIKDFVEKVTGVPYVKGQAFYELSKTELVQGGKEIVIVHKGSDLKRYGGAEARQILGLGVYDMKVKPGDHGDWRIFVQSTSLNRKIIAGTSIFIKA